MARYHHPHRFRPSCDRSFALAAGVPSLEAIFIPLGAIAGPYLIAAAQRSKLVLEENAVTVYTVFGSKRLERQDIKGFWAEDTGENFVWFISRTRRLPSISIFAPVMEKDDVLKKWVGSLTNLNIDYQAQPWYNRRNYGRHPLPPPDD